jgi:hypothetical protein
MLTKITDEYDNSKSCEQTISTYASVVSDFSSSAQSSEIHNSSYTHTLFIAKICSTTGTTSQDVLLRKYLANSDLISIYYRESITNFIITVDNKDS